MYERLIKKYEGCKLEAYKCPAGIWTIGWGNTYLKDGTKVDWGMKISQEYADELLNMYIEKNIIPTINDIGQKLTEGQKEALASLIYNWGRKGFLNSKLYQAIRKKDYKQVIKEWDLGFINDLKGIYKRRTEELFLFIKDI